MYKIKVVSQAKLVILFSQLTHLNGAKQNNQGKCLKLDGIILENLETPSILSIINL